MYFSTLFLHSFLEKKIQYITTIIKTLVPYPIKKKYNLIIKIIHKKLHTKIMYSIILLLIYFLPILFSYCTEAFFK